MKKLVGFPNRFDGDNMQQKPESVHESVENNENNKIIDIDDDINWGDYKPEYLCTPLNPRLVNATNTEDAAWKTRRRPKENDLHSTNLSKKYMELVDAKIEISILQLSLMKEEVSRKREHAEEEHKLRKRVLELEIEKK